MMKLLLQFLLFLLLGLVRVHGQGGSGAPSPVPAVGGTEGTPFPTAEAVGGEEETKPQSVWFEDEQAAPATETPATAPETASSNSTDPSGGSDNNAGMQLGDPVESSTLPPGGETQTTTETTNELPSSLAGNNQTQPGDSMSSSAAGTAPPSTGMGGMSGPMGSEMETTNPNVPSSETMKPSKVQTDAPSGDDAVGGEGEGNDEFGGEGEGNDDFGGEGEGNDDFGGEGNDDMGEQGTDDMGEFEGGEDEFGGEGEWGEDEERTKAPYVPPTGDDPFAKPPDESEWSGGDWPQETPEQMMHDRNVIIAVSAAVIFGVVLAIFSAQQLIENPDGCIASICRCNVKIFCCFFKILCFPCRMCCGNKDRRNHDLIMGSDNNYTHDLELT